MLSDALLSVIMLRIVILRVTAHCNVLHLSNSGFPNKHPSLFRPTVIDKNNSCITLAPDEEEDEVALTCFK